jgi:hypothetical protein
VGTKLYAGGSFTTADGLPVNRVAVWDGNTWSALGSGVSNFLAGASQISAMGVRGGDVFFGGPITLAGLKPAFNFARWNEQIDFDVMPTIQLSKLTASSIGPFKMTVTASGVPSYVIEGTTDFSSWTPLLTNTTSPYEFWDFTAPGHPYRFYRARQGP